ncbi:MAG: hypothetical protein GY845_03130 [Planctomycetes bacterium]|nr:hypothetical protein [Planctomycetota bacterium]
MPLMDRIKVQDFLSLSEPAQLNFIDTIRKARSAAVTFALEQKKKKIPRKSIKKRAKSPRAQAAKKAKAEAALKLLTPEQIAKLAKMF